MSERAVVSQKYCSVGEDLFLVHLVTSGDVRADVVTALPGRHNRGSTRIHGCRVLRDRQVEDLALDDGHWIGRRHVVVLLSAGRNSGTFAISLDNGAQVVLRKEHEIDVSGLVMAVQSETGAAELFEVLALLLASPAPTSTAIRDALFSAACSAASSSLASDDVRWGIDHGLVSTAGKLFVEGWVLPGARSGDGPVGLRALSAQSILAGTQGAFRREDLLGSVPDHVPASCPGFAVTGHLPVPLPANILIELSAGSARHVIGVPVRRVSDAEFSATFWMRCLDLHARHLDVPIAFPRPGRVTLPVRAQSVPAGRRTLYVTQFPIDTETGRISISSLLDQGWFSRLRVLLPFSRVAPRVDFALPPALLGVDIETGWSLAEFAFAGEPQTCVVTTGDCLFLASAEGAIAKAEAMMRRQPELQAVAITDESADAPGQAGDKRPAALPALSVMRTDVLAGAALSFWPSAGLALSEALRSLAPAELGHVSTAAIRALHVEPGSGWMSSEQRRELRDLYRRSHAG